MVRILTHMFSSVHYLPFLCDLYYAKMWSTIYKVYGERFIHFDTPSIVEHWSPCVVRTMPATCKKRLLASSWNSRLHPILLSCTSWTQCAKRTGLLRAERASSMNTKKQSGSQSYTIQFRWLEVEKQVAISRYAEQLKRNLPKSRASSNTTLQIYPNLDVKPRTMRVEGRTVDLILRETEATAWVSNVKIATCWCSRLLCTRLLFCWQFTAIPSTWTWTTSTKEVHAMLAPEEWVLLLRFVLYFLSSLSISAFKTHHKWPLNVLGIVVQSTSHTEGVSTHCMTVESSLPGPGLSQATQCPVRKSRFLSRPNKKAFKKKKTFVFCFN